MCYEDFNTIFSIKNALPTPDNQNLRRIYSEIYQIQQILREIKKELSKINELLQLLWEYMHEDYIIPPASPANKHIDSKDLIESKSFDNFKSGGFAFCSNVCFLKNKHLRQNSIKLEPGQNDIQTIQILPAYLIDIYKCNNYINN